ncbi:hypothetical protein [Nocardia panacis]|nr:hypothetical protein [Nocardia panacis]
MGMLNPNGADVDASTDDAYDFVIAVATGELDEVKVIAEQLERWLV